MSLISISSKKSRIHLSAENVSAITSEYSHNIKDCVSDVVILPINQTFLQFLRSSKDSWINICKIKKEGGDKDESIQLCVKNKVENVVAATASKVKKSDLCYANGYSNGQIKIRDLKTNKVVKEFRAPSNSSVFFMDFNASDEHLASVYEDGLINIYGMQTSVKLHSFTLDNQSTLVRFHPQKKSHLGVASYSGKVSLLDIYAKKVIFKNDGHNGPCTDIGMFEDFLLSSGYDGVVKIFDLRKSSPGIQIQASYGWTSIALSKCGVYFVGGNMKGELISYDMRYIKKPLSSARIEESNHKISRVAFLSCEEGNSSFPDSLNAVRQSLCKIEEDCDDKAPVEPNESFIEEIYGFQRGRISDFSSSVMNYETRVSTASRRSSTDSQFADYCGKNIQEALKDISTPTQSPASGPNLDDSRVNKTRRRLSGKDIKLRPSIGTALKEIKEEFQNDKENDAKTLNAIDISVTPVAVNTAPRYSSTPSVTMINNIRDDKNTEIIEIEGDDSFKSVQNGEFPTNKNEQLPSRGFDFRKEFDALAEKMRIEIGSMNMDQNMRHIELMSHIGDQGRQIQNRIVMIEESIAVLMNDDFKINLINELQAENQQLRQQVNELVRRLSH